MRLTLIILLNALFIGQITAQENGLSKIKWTEASDTLKTKLKAGYYLCRTFLKGMRLMASKTFRTIIFMCYQKTTSWI